jgi:ABC-type phosphate/phosphonate transport system substrate-binding protein
MLATLPMYDWPEVRGATDQFWAILARTSGYDILLNRSGNYMDAWNDPALVFSQSCGYPFTHQFRDKLIYVATAHYNADGCNGSNYCSIILAREQKPVSAFRHSRAAINSPDSMSGMLALKLVTSPYDDGVEFFSDVVESGGHTRSMELVRDGMADMCAIDAVCVDLARRYRPRLLEGLHEIARSPLVPGLPYVTRFGDPEKLAKALQSVINDPANKDVMKTLLISGLSILPVSAYDRIIDLENKMSKRESN